MKTRIFLPLILLMLTALSCEDEPITPNNPTPTTPTVQGVWKHQKDSYESFQNGVSGGETNIDDVALPPYNFAADGVVYYETTVLGSHTPTTMTFASEVYTVTEITATTMVAEMYPDGDFPGTSTTGTNHKKYFIK